MGYRFGNVGIHSRVEGGFPVRVPFVVRRPEPCHQENCEFAKHRWKRTFESDVVTKVSDSIGKLRAPEQGWKRPAHAAPRTARNGFRHPRLVRTHFFRGQGPKPWYVHRN